ncbi:DUF4198 domain-containing protein [Mucilaginibacter agri]|uniref:DUF4198 domain-containing protein n=1 Tax=Mucilaginibacter agri TaxID=2695265 RepID=A0A965ZDS7_9SPHI|nr:DUF4198 domain-containing protein [Mucilaginibacter agri]NCD69198.1 DUF4198 domain-containing protein [Mucilaginibacter agri]
MKNVLLTLIFLTFAAGAAHSQFLLPEDFFPHKGDNLNLHLLSGESFGKGQEQKFDPKRTAKVLLLDGGKPNDLTSLIKLGEVSTVNAKLESAGVAMLAVVEQSADDIDRKEFINYLTNAGQDKAVDGLKQFQQSFRLKSTNILKTLVAVEKNGGGVQEKPLKEDYEIILKQNPYKGSYGDDVTGVLLFKGEPIKSEKVTLIIRSPRGVEFPQLLATDEKGLFYFKLSREGTYMLQSLHMEPAKDQTLDFESWQTSFTFAFSSNNTMPNTYKEFGLGNMH